MNRLIIVGSPRPHGRSAHLAELLFEACIEDCPHDVVAIASVSSLDVGPCTGCDTCKSLAENSSKVVDQDAHSKADTNRKDGADTNAIAYAGGIEKESSQGKPAGEETLPNRCVIKDDMAEVYRLVDDADELIVVSPVYFAAPPAQLKALLDRLQPYFWTNARKEPKRPAVLHVVGEGGDPHGYDPLIGTVCSALSCAGFHVETVFDWVGRIDEEGEIIAEASVWELDERTVSYMQEGSRRV